MSKIFVEKYLWKKKMYNNLHENNLEDIWGKYFSENHNEHRNITSLVCGFDLGYGHGHIDADGFGDGCTSGHENGEGAGFGCAYGSGYLSGSGSG